MNGDRNWNAIGAVAAVASVLIAIVTLAAQCSASGATSGAAPQASSYSNTYAYSSAPTDSDTPTPFTAPTTPVTDESTSAAPPFALSQGRPAGCDEALAAVNEYGKNASAATTAQARGNVAWNARLSLMSASLDAGEPVYSQDVALESDFGALAQDYWNGDSDTADVARANADIRTLTSDCGSG
jgi:hypothetical protein